MEKNPLSTESPLAAIFVAHSRHELRWVPPKPPHFTTVPSYYLLLPLLGDSVSILNGNCIENGYTISNRDSIIKTSQIFIFSCWQVKGVSNTPKNVTFEYHMPNL